MGMYTQTFFELDNFPYNATYDYSCVTKNCENDSWLLFGFCKVVVVCYLCALEVIIC